MEIDISMYNRIILYLYWLLKTLKWLKYNNDSDVL
jgi:hypothetical protein